MNELDKLQKLGFKKAVNKVQELKELKRKMVIAYEHFRYVKPEKIDAFNEKLEAETTKEDKYRTTYKKLNFIGLDDYEEVPPLDVLNKMEEAQALGCFDYFEIAKIQDVVVVKDPIVFGRINKCPDRFFVAQWDDDVSISDLLKENEG